MSQDISPHDPHQEFLIYQSDDGSIQIHVTFRDETIWMTQKMMAELFDTTPQNITLHLKNIFEEQELTEETTCKDFLQVQKEGERSVQRNQKFYNLDAIIVVGYRISFLRATQFLKQNSCIHRSIQEFLKPKTGFFSISMLPRRDISETFPVGFIAVSIFTFELIL